MMERWKRGDKIAIRILLKSKRYLVMLNSRKKDKGKDNKE